MVDAKKHVSRFENNGSLICDDPLASVGYFEDAHPCNTSLNPCIGGFDDS